MIDIAIRLCTVVRISTTTEWGNGFASWSTEENTPMQVGKNSSRFPPPPALGVLICSTRFLAVSEQGEQRMGNNSGPLHADTYMYKEFLIESLVNITNREWRSFSGVCPRAMAPPIKGFFLLRVTVTPQWRVERITNLYCCVNLTWQNSFKHDGLRLHVFIIHQNSWRVIFDVGWCPCYWLHIITMHAEVPLMLWPRNKIRPSSNAGLAWWGLDLSVFYRSFHSLGKPSGRRLPHVYIYHSGPVCLVYTYFQTSSVFCCGDNTP